MCCANPLAHQSNGLAFEWASRVMLACRQMPSRRHASNAVTRRIGLTSQFSRRRFGLSYLLDEVDLRDVTVRRGVAPPELPAGYNRPDSERAGRMLVPAQARG